MGRKLTIFLIDGTEVGPRTVEIGNWSGKAIYSKRSAISKIINRSEFDKPGIYILRGTPQNDIYSERIYIGEAEKLGKRLKQHLSASDKDFSEFIAFLSKDEFLTKSHIKYLESLVIKLAKEANNSELDNSNQPELPMLPEPDISDMEYFLEQIKLILPLMNFMFLVPSVISYSETIFDTQDDQIHKIYSLTNKKIVAQMYESDKGFIVLSGSQCNKKISSSISDGWVKLRNKLINSGTLLDSGTYYVFKENAVFSSISAATAVILGRQVAGPLMWKDTKGKTYKENMMEVFNEEEI